MKEECRDFREWEAFAKKLATKYVTPGVDLDDLEQEALLVLLEKLPEYSPQIGVSLKVFLGRKIRNKLAELYRKSLNLVQLEQYWEVRHASGDKELHVRASSRAEAAAILQLHSTDYVSMKHVKTLVVIGPSMDADAESDATNEDPHSLHEVVGQAPEQEWAVAINRRLSALRAVPQSQGEAEELHTIFSMRRDGFTFAQIGKQLGKDGCAVKKTWYRAQKRSQHQRQSRTSEAA